MGEPVTTRADAVADAVLARLESVLGPAETPIALHEPSIEASERAHVLACLDSTFVSSVGEYVNRFERALESFTGARHAVVVSNGTAALQVAMTLAGVRPGDEVIVPALSFVATANAVAHCGATPHFVDSDKCTMGLSPEALADHLATVAERRDGDVCNRQTGARMAAIVPMHAYGHPMHLDQLLEVAAHYGLPVVEDAAESLGSWYGAQHTGTLGLLGTLSFNGNKVVTSGSGGAILTNDSVLAGRAKHVTTTAKRAHRWEFFHDEVAWNYRMSNLSAALGVAQMERLPEFLTQKRALAARYARVFGDCVQAMFMAEPPGTTSNYWLNTIRLAEPDAEVREAVLTRVNDAGYQCRPTWVLLHRLPMYASAPRAPLPVAERLEASLISLPSTPRLAERAGQ
jgi:perosamine synthetase